MSQQQQQQQQQLLNLERDARVENRFCGRKKNIAFVNRLQKELRNFRLTALLQTQHVPYCTVLYIYNAEYNAIFIF